MHLTQYNLYLIITLVCLSLGRIVFAGQSFQQIVIFGDDYSYSENTYTNSKNTYPEQAYYLDYFFNGPIWSEYFYYDRIHSTAYINKLMSDDLFLFLTQNKWINKT